jgi:hypothetical protein
MQWAVAGLRPAWRLRRDYLSRSYTTQWQHLPLVYAR